MKKSKTKYFSLLLIIILVPWLNANYIDDIKIKYNYLESSFFEINPCKTSLFEFLYFEREIESNEFENDNYSSIVCFGRISQVKNSNTFFIGTNLLINIVIYVLIFTYLLKFKFGNLENYRFINLNYIFLTTLIICSLFFSDRKFYETKLYFLDPFKFRTYVFLYLFIFCISYLLIESYFKFEIHIVNILPFLFLFTGNILDSNFNIFIIIFLYLGVEQLFKDKKISKYFKFYIALTFVWSINAREVYIFSHNPYLGFSATSYDFYSTFFYSIFFFIFLIGANRFIKKSIIHFSYQKFMNAFSLVIILNTSLYTLQKKFPLLKIFENIFFGFRETINFSSESLNKNLFYNENILFIFCFLFLFKFFNTFKLQKSDTLALLIFLYGLLSIPNYISNIHLKLNTIEKFFVVYNPTFLEIILGSGPLNFNQLYLESSQKTILTQHSLLVSTVLFFGLLGSISFGIFLFHFMKMKNRLLSNKIFTTLIISSFLLNDSINYLSTLIIYILLLNLLKNHSRDKFGFSKNK